MHTVNWEGEGFKNFFVFKLCSGCHGECFREEIDIDEIFFFPQKKTLLKKRDNLQRPCDKLTVKAMKDKTLTEGGSKCKLYSANLCKYTHFTSRSVSKSNILRKNFVYYCTVQDSARNVL